MIALLFPNPDDSPTRRSPLRIRYAFDQVDGRTVPVLRYGHGTGALTADAWRGYQAAGAQLQADTDRERQVLREVLGDDCLPVPQP